MIKLFRHRGCIGVQWLQIGRWTSALWIVPRTTKLAPHSHPGQTVLIIPLLSVRTTFNVLHGGVLKTVRAWPFRPLLTRPGHLHFANKSDPNRERVGPFIFLNIIRWEDGNPKHPKDGYE